MSCKKNEMQLQKLFNLIVCVHIVVSVISSMFSPEMMSCQTDMKVNLSLAKDLLRNEWNTWSNRNLWNYNIGGNIKVNLSLAKDLLRNERDTWSNRIL